MKGSSLSFEPASDSVRNLRAFAKLYGYVRYFHPSDAAVGLDWDAFAVFGCRRVMDLDSSAALREELERLFAPIAPTVHLFDAEESTPPPDPVLAPEDGDELDVVAWQHEGVGMGASQLYRSRRTHRTVDRGPDERPQIEQSIEADPYRGETVRLEGNLHLEEASAAGFGLSVWSPDGEGTPEPHSHEATTEASDWTGHSLEVDVPEEATRLGVTVLLEEHGRVRCDRAELSVQREDGSWDRIEYPNWNFEDETIEGWGEGWKLSGLDCDVSVEEDESEGRVAVLETLDEEPLFEERPAAGDAIRRPLGRGLAVQLPIALHSRDGVTVDVSKAPPRDELEAQLEALEYETVRTEFDPAFRVAVVAIIWNVARHFFPYFDEIGADWEEALPQALEAVLNCENTHQFGMALDHMIAQLEDGHARTSFGARYEAPEQWLPVDFEVIEGELVVIATDDDCEEVRVGDLLESIVDVETEETFEVDEAFETWRARASGSEQWTARRAIAGIRAGPSENPVPMRFSRDGESIEVQLERGAYGVLEEDRPPTIHEMDEAILYADLTRLSEDEFDSSLERFAAADRIVFDVRGYPGPCAKALLSHLADRPLRSVHHLVPRVLFPDRMIETGWSHIDGRWWLDPESPDIEATCAFLTDARAISYAESIMCIVDAYDLGTIVGSPTAGTNGNVNTYRFPGGNVFQFTGMRVRRHDGTQHHLHGVRPDVPVERTLEGVRAGHDEVLERGLEVVS